MIVTILAILVNGIIIAGIMEIVQGVFQFDLSLFNPYLMLFGLKITTQNAPYWLTGALMGAVVTLGLTPAADTLLRLSYGFRKPLKDEGDKLQRLFEDVCYAAKVEPGKFKVYVMDDLNPNACALGYNQIAVTRGLLKTFSDNEIKGILAHEMGHLHYGDTIRNRVFITVSILGQISLFGYHCLSGIFSMLSKIPIPLLNLFFFLMSLFFSFVTWFMQLLLVLPLGVGAMFGVRQNEYRADRYALEIGQGEGLYSALYRFLDSDNVKPSGFLAILHRSHPDTGKRIHKIEQMQGKTVQIFGNGVIV